MGVVKDKETYKEIVTISTQKAKRNSDWRRKARNSHLSPWLNFWQSPIPLLSPVFKNKNKNWIFIFRGIIMDDFIWNTSDFYNAVSILETLLKVVCPHGGRQDHLFQQARKHFTRRSCSGVRKSRGPLVGFSIMFTFSADYAPSYSLCLKLTLPTA